MSEQAVKKIVLNAAKNPLRPGELVTVVIQKSSAKAPPQEAKVRHVVREMIKAGELVLTGDRRIRVA